MIEIISHCYNPPGTDQYAQLLKWQIASLANYQPNVDVCLTVCCSKDDEALHVMMQQIYRHLPGEIIYCINLLYLPHERLFRRAIGRNMRARQTSADVVWFTDCDYAFGPGCLLFTDRAIIPSCGLLMPDRCKISYDVNGHFSESYRDRPHHATGDAAIKRERNNPLPLLNDSEFKQREEHRAIGGLQIIGGDTARRIGYLDGTKWVEPVDPSLGFRSCRCDAAWRKHNKLQATRLPIPNVYRIRHLADGRDMNQSGEVIGKEAW